MGEPCAAAAARQVWRYLRQFPSPCSSNRSLLRQAARGSPHPSRPTGLWQISRSCGYFLFLRPAPTPVINVQKQGGCSTSAKCYRPLDASRASFQILPPPVRLLPPVETACWFSFIDVKLSLCTAISTVLRFNGSR